MWPEWTRCGRFIILRRRQFCGDASSVVAPVLWWRILAPHAYATCLRHIPAPHTYATYLRHMPAPHACATCLRHMPTPHACATYLRHTSSFHCILFGCPHSGIILDYKGDKTHSKPE
ncbi:MAG: hypothetical protein GX946_06810 [Oligosphaeraceae bacterium]|nr:hypothetical protein [Oligosphaeraceae bacterium]